MNKNPTNLGGKPTKNQCLLLTLMYRLWNRVIAGIIRSNDDDAWKEKTRLEDKQRKEEAEREAKKTEWKPALFKKADKDGWIYSQWE